jgi:hypothetical protein
MPQDWTWLFGTRKQQTLTAIVAAVMIFGFSAIYSVSQRDFLWASISVVVAIFVSTVMYYDYKRREETDYSL